MHLKLSIAAAIPMRWWHMMARTKTHDPLRQFRWVACGRASNTAFEVEAVVSVIESASRFDGADES